MNASQRLLPALLVLALSVGGARAATDAGTYSGHGFAPVKGTRLFYEVAGSGEPLVLIHGGQLDSRMWDDQFETFARSFRVLRYDIRGFGGSPIPEAPYSNAEDLAALMDYLGMAQAHLVGLSLGGMVASDFAVARPSASCHSCSRVPASPGSTPSPRRR